MLIDTNNITPEEALKLYPELNPTLLKCPCGNTLKAYKAELTKDFIYLIAHPCPCGNYGEAMTGVCNSEVANQKWRNIFNQAKEAILANERNIL